MIIAALLAFPGFANAWGHSAGTARTGAVKIRTLQIDAAARPGIGQFVPADDDVQHLVYELFVVNWNGRDLRFAAVDAVLLMPRSGVTSNLFQSSSRGAGPPVNPVSSERPGSEPVRRTFVPFAIVISYIRALRARR